MNSTTASVQIVDGNGWRYIIVHGVAPDGQPFVAVPSLGAAAIMTPYPAEHGYIQQKLGISEVDAKIIFDALRKA